MFAPERLRERKIRSGISGVRAVASRTMNATSSATESAPRQEGRGRSPAVVGRRLDDRVDAEHQRGGDQHRAGHVGALAEADPLVALDQPPRQHGGGHADRDVDEEDPVPVDRLGQHAAGKQADRAARRGDEAVHADRLGLVARRGEHRHDHPEHDRRRHGAADALDEARRHQHLLALRGAAQDRRGDEDDQAGHEDVLAPDEVAEAAREQQQPAEADQVGVDHPGEARLGEAEVVLDRRQRHVHDGHVEHDHQDARAEHVERDPAVSVRHLLSHRFVSMCRCHFKLRPPRGADLIGAAASAARRRSHRPRAYPRRCASRPDLRVARAAPSLPARGHAPWPRRSP